jgi:manganese/zinc/iron transport system substrate-binding protein
MPRTLIASKLGARRWVATLVAIVVIGSAVAGLGARPEAAAVWQDRITVVTTTGQVGDLVGVVGGERVEVTSLMGPGVDPHLYKASEGDVQTLADADAIFYNGLNLEGKMGDILERLGQERPVIAVTDEIPTELLRQPPEFEGNFDPHVWFDVSLWLQALARVERALTEIDPEGASAFEANAAAYRAELEALDAYAKEQIALIPAERRVLVTAHDAFGYFGQRYAIDVVGLQGISTETEAGIDDVQRVAQLVTDRQVKAIFVETSVSPAPSRPSRRPSATAAATSPSAVSSTPTPSAKPAPRRHLPRHVSRQRRHHRRRPPLTGGAGP